MPLLDVIQRNARRSVELYRELAAEIPEPVLVAKLPGLPSNSVGQQLWCVIGARESYCRAIRAGEWKGFACSVTGDGCRSRRELAEGLARSGAEFLSILDDGPSLTDGQHQWVLDLLEHEASHQGQLIRYLYGLGLRIPDGWKSRYALT